MTLNDIQLAAYRRCGYQDTPAPEVAVRMLQWINIWQQRLCARPGIELLRDIGSVFPSVPDQAVYILPVEVRRIKKITDPVTPVSLRMESHQWMREIDPGKFASGIPEVWAPVTWGQWDASTPVPHQALSIRLWPTPTVAITYLMDCQTTAIDLVNLTDKPLLPYEFHWLLVEAACYEEWLRKADARAGTARQDLETGVKEMRHWLYSPIDYRPTNLPQDNRPSRLGGMYPGW